MTLSPKQIVTELDKHIIGQTKAKKAVAIALRNRWRRQQIEEPLRREITPKNILMIGPTGVGKSEIARRLADLAQAPFIKIDATKFTEVGYVGRDVDSIVRDLIEVSMKQHREKTIKSKQAELEICIEEYILDVLLPGSSDGDSHESTREKFRQKLRSGELNDKEIEIEVSIPNNTRMELLAPAGMEDLTDQLQGMFQNFKKSQKKTKTVKVSEAGKLLRDDLIQSLLDEDQIRSQAIAEAEQNGIIFIDEIDKIAVSQKSHQSSDISRQGVQRDLLPLIEGTTVSTKYGMIKTDHILFIASGAFHFAKPSDLIPELQGRFPIRVELEPLLPQDFEKILTTTNACLTKQYQALLATENIHIEFTQDSVEKLAEIAWNINDRVENIGARRLYTVLEKLLETLSFQSILDRPSQQVTIDADFVSSGLSELSANHDLARYIL